MTSRAPPAQKESPGRCLVRVPVEAFLGTQKKLQTLLCRTVAWVLPMAGQWVMMVARLKVLKPCTSRCEAVSTLRLIIFMGTLAGSLELTSAAKNTQ